MMYTNEYTRFKGKEKEEFARLVTRQYIEKGGFLGSEWWRAIYKFGNL